MAIDLTRTFRNPISKESFRCLSYDKKAYKMEWTVEPQGYVMIEHIHLTQDEKFDISSGEMRLVVDGKEIFLRQGDSYTVPKGVSHVAYNDKAENLVCDVTYSPGLDHYTWMQCFAGLVMDGHIDEQGALKVPMAGYMLRRMNAQCMTRPTKIPAPAFGAALWLFYVMGIFSGWGKLYDNYTG